MTGGLFQLVAKGAEDISIITDPQITFFKTIYRRYTNFSRSEQELYFNSPLDFGKKAICKIKRYGDLLHRLFLIIVLPEIDIVYDSLTIKKVLDLLSQYDIKWDTNKSLNEIFDNNDYVEIKILIEKKIEKINNDLSIIEKMENILNLELNPDIFFETHNSCNENVDDYIDFVIRKLIIFDELWLIVKFFDAYIQDIKQTGTQNRVLMNYEKIKSFLFDKMISFIIGIDNKNLLFLFNVSRLQENIASIDNRSNSIFRTEISRMYNNESEYISLDAYKIFNEVLNNSNINNKTQLMNNIKFGLIKNIRILKNIYGSFKNDSKFIFYRLFKKKDNYFDLNSEFQNLSLINHNQVEFNDNFTNDFIIYKESYESSYIYHPLTNIINNLLHEFHINNKLLFRNGIFNDYFNFINLWTRLDLKASEHFKEIIMQITNNNPNKFSGIYFLNYIPFLTVEDIPLAIRKILDRERIKFLNEGNLIMSNKIEAMINIIIPKLIDKRNDIIRNLMTKIGNIDDIKIIDKLNNIRTEQDILMIAIYRQDAILPVNGIYYPLPKYVIYEYQDLINSFSSEFIPGYDSEIKSLIEEVMNLFQISESFIDFTTYYKNEFNFRFDLKINNSQEIFSDAISSIWLNLFQGFINNYNDFYRKLLEKKGDDDHIGYELLSNILKINKELFNKTQMIDYYSNSTLNDFQIKLSSIETFLNEKLEILKEQIKHFEENSKLLNIKNITLPIQDYYFERYQTIVNLIFSEIEDDSYFEYCCHQGIMDIVIMIKNEFIKFITTCENPFLCSIEPNKFELWNSFYLYKNKNKIHNIESYEIEKFQSLYDNINSHELYKSITMIESEYNSFLFETDVYRFLKDIAIKNSILREFSSIKKTNVIETFKNLQIFLNNKKNILIQLKENIISSSATSLCSILKRSLLNNSARFAWIRKIGHYIIDYIVIKIGDQIIDKHYGEWLEIWHELTKREQKERGYKILIGDIPELTEFNNKKKEEYELIIPLQFWFCREIGRSLPLIALNHIFVELSIKLNDFNQVAIFDEFTKFKKKPKLKCKMLAEYIYIEDKERRKIVTSKNEYLIETLQFNGNLQINKNSLDEEDRIKHKLHFKYPCKEIFWVFQNSAFITGIAPNNEKKYFNYGSDFITGKINPGSEAKIKFNDRDREEYKDIEFYNYIQPYERHYATPSDGINVYSFSLFPEKYQPSGTANLGKIENVSLEIRLKKQIAQEIREKNSIFNWRIYATSYNILRIFSGLGGLAYQYG